MTTNSHTVQATVERMIRAFPTLYRTRAMALMALFDSSSARWVNGCLVDPQYEVPRSDDDILPYPEATPLASDGSNADQVLFEREENAKARFVFENAHLLASGKRFARQLEREYSVDFDGRHFDDMPEDVDPEWKSAALELALVIVAHRPTQREDQDRAYRESRAKRHEEAQALCRQFLERHQVSKPCPYARAARVKKLLREAQAIGMVLTESDGTAPRTTA